MPKSGYEGRYRRRGRTQSCDRLLPGQGPRITDVAVLEKGYVGGDNTIRNMP